jgi:tetratricopeptide (TPR) repeat protein
MNAAAVSPKELVDRAREATRRHDWDEAFRRWDAVLRQDPGNPLAYHSAGNALRYAGRVDEAEALLGTARARFPDHQLIAIGHARVAAARRDWPEALLRWEAVQKRFPERPEGQTGVAQARRELDQLEALRVRQKRKERQELVQQAREAVARRDWPEALRRWEAVQKRFPDRPEGHAGVAQAQRALDRLEAVRVWRELVAQAREAVARRDWSEALRRWEAVGKRFPDRPEGHAGAAQARRALDRLEEARVRRELVEQAQEAVALGDWLEASRRWHMVVQQHPDEPGAYFHASGALRQAGRPDEAEALLATATDRFPDHESLAIEYARAAGARRDWAAALPRWQAVRARFPDRPEGYTGAAEAMRALGRPDQAAALLDDGKAALAAAKGRGLDEESALSAEIEFATAGNDWQTVRRLAERLAAAQTPALGQTLLALARSCWHLEDLEGAESAAMRALAAQPTLADAALIGAWVAGERGDGKKALANYRTVARLRHDQPRFSLQVVRALELLGRAEEAASELARVAETWPGDPLIAGYRLAQAVKARAQSSGASEGQTAANGAPSRAWHRTLAKPPAEPAGEPSAKVRPRHQIVVLGMHRSGTSLVTAALQAMGAYLGEAAELMTPNLYNPRGYFERNDTRAICDTLLRAAGAEWWKIVGFDCAQIPAVANAEQDAKIAALVGTLDRKGIWALKDPRLSLLLPIFLPHLKYPIAIVPYRHPLEVAASLRRRDRLPQAAALALWEAYTIAALRVSAHLPRLFIGHAELLRNPAETLARLQHALEQAGIKGLQEADANLVVDSRLHRHQARTENVSAAATPEQLRLWRALGDADAVADAPTELSSRARAVLAKFENSIRSLRLYV